VRLSNRTYPLLGIILCLLALGPCSLAGTGTTTAQFLVKTLGARAGGMGNAFSAMEDDVNVILWNPAGVATLTQPQTTFLYSDLGPVFNIEGAGDMYHGIILYGAPWGTKSGIAIGAQYEEQGKISYTTDSPEVIATYNLGANYSILLSYARRLSPHLILGATFKLVHTQLWEYEDTGWAVDVGAFYQLENLNLGFSINNVGEKLVMEDAYQADPLPQNTKLGLLYKLLISQYSRVNIALDITKPAQSDLEYHTGIEYWYHSLLALRVGYLKEEGKVEGFTQGVGVRIGGLQIDFANVPWGELGSVQRFSLTITL